jgi:cytochrome c
MACGIVLSVARAAMLSLLFATAEPARGEDGKALLAIHCGRCHALAERDASPLSGAPNLWTVLRSYEQEQLEFELSEGIGSRHSDMPQIQFSSEEISSTQDYLFGRTQRAR